MHTVRLKDGKQIAADMVVVAVGAALNTELAEAAGLEIDPSGGVKTDEFLQTSDPNIWAAGDIACFQDVVLGKRWHVEHHLNAKWQGQAVGKIMAGGDAPYDQVPYFFSDFLDLHMILRGDTEGGKKVDRRRRHGRGRVHRALHERRRPARHGHLDQPR